MIMVLFIFFTFVTSFDNKELFNYNFNLYIFITVIIHLMYLYILYCCITVLLYYDKCLAYLSRL